MKYLLLFMLSVLSIYSLQAQTIYNTDDFQAGAIFKYKECVAAGVTPGNSGLNQTWNFASLSPLPDTLTELMELPASTPLAANYPNANLVERRSNGSYVFIQKTPAGNFIEGYVDPNQNVSISYPNSQLIAKRPLTFGSTSSDPFTTTYIAAGFNFEGQGNSVIEADGFGTLVLPNGTFTNVMRVKITSTQADTLRQFGTITHTVSTSYGWYDGIRPEPLLKMEHTTSGTFSRESVSYLLLQTSTPTGAAEDRKASLVQVHPNPANHHFTFTSDQKGTLSISDHLGRVLKVMPIQDNQTRLSTEMLRPGVYNLQFQTEKGNSQTRLLVQH